MTAYLWYATCVAIVAVLFVVILGLAYDRNRRELLAFRRLLSGLPRCGMVCDEGLENRTCSCRGPANCQPDLRRFEVLRRAYERADSDFARASRGVDERPPDANARPPDPDPFERLVGRTYRSGQSAPVVQVMVNDRRTLLESDLRRT